MRMTPGFGSRLIGAAMIGGALILPALVAGAQVTGVSAQTTAQPNNPPPCTVFVSEDGGPDLSSGLVCADASTQGGTPAVPADIVVPGFGD